MTELLSRHLNEHTIIRVRLRTGVWEVSRDGVFFGDYLRRQDAMAAADAAATAFRAMGGQAEIEAPPQAREARRRRELVQ